MFVEKDKCTFNCIEECLYLLYFNMVSGIIQNKYSLMFKKEYQLQGEETDNGCVWNASTSEYTCMKFLMSFQRGEKSRMAAIKPEEYR